MNHKISQQRKEKMRIADFTNGNGFSCQVTIVRSGKKNTRVIFADGHDELVSSSTLSNQREQVESVAYSSNRVVPITPLRRLYRELRKVKGTPQEKFETVRNRFIGRKGPELGAFLAWLFERSRTQMQHYDNRHEHFFVPGARGSRSGNRQSAIRLAEQFMIGAENAIHFDDGVPSFSGVAYEINPLRTTASCWEDGRKAKDSGSGGLDLLLTAPSEGNNMLPWIGEVKAQTETVGPTFALIQALTYAAELVVDSQWQRLCNHFVEYQLCRNIAPRLKVALFFESVVLMDEDMRFAMELANSFASMLDKRNLQPEILFFSYDFTHDGRVNIGAIHNNA